MQHHRGPLDRDLTQDSAPLGRTASAPPHHNTSSSSSPKSPEVMNFSGCQGLHFGPKIYMPMPSAGQQQQQPLLTTATPRPDRDAVMQMLQSVWEEFPLNGLTREVSESDKFLVSQHLGDLWRQLGREMGYSSGQLDNIDNDYRRQQDKVYELLTLWHDRESGAATFDQLLRLLMRVQAFEVVNKLRETVL